MLDYCVVDAFTSKPFAGNPAAVYILDRQLEEHTMSLIAREMNLSETAFPLRISPGVFKLRWFTPEVEVALCGHATLASAHAIWEQGEKSEVLSFHTLSGVLEAKRLSDGWIALNFPATPAVETDAPDGLLEALGCQAKWVGRSRHDYLVEVESEATVRALNPDHTALKKLPVRGIMVTAASSEFDFVSRFFAPGSGVTEDPVCGSAHCALSPYWSQRLGKSRLHAYQASQRGGELRLEMLGDRIQIEGQAVTTSTGRLLLGPRLP